MIYKVGDDPKQLEEDRLQTEDVLEEMIFKNPGILSDHWLLIGRQVQTSYNKIMDLLMIDVTGSLIIVELKRNKTPREVVAQVLDYATWLKKLSSNEIAEIYATFCNSYLDGSMSLNEAFEEKFNVTLNEDDLNSSHQLVVVAAELDSSTERIIGYLNEYNIPVNAVLFRVFRDGSNQYLSRAWFVDPTETQEKATQPKASEPWNGEFYVSFGEGKDRSWEDARKFGFISAGGGKWYSNTLNKLEKNDRVWVNVPKSGYVGVGIVEEPAVKCDEFYVKSNGKSIPVLEIPTEKKYHREYIDDDDKAEYFVRVKWIKDVPVNKAKSEIGFFGNQNTVCQPTTPKWNHTVERLKKLFNIQ